MNRLHYLQNIIYDKITWKLAWGRENAPSLITTTSK